MDWWRVAETIIKTNGLVSHQLTSYNEFLRFKLPKLIQNTQISFEKKDEETTIQFDNIIVCNPENKEPNGVIHKLMPWECRVRNLTYSSDIKADVIQISKNERKVSEQVVIANIPMMIGSIFCNLDPRKIHKQYECPMDPGGYFIINGNDRVLMSHDRMAHNEIFVFKEKKDKYSHTAIVRSYNEDVEPNISTTILKITSANVLNGIQPLIFVELSSFKDKEIAPIAILFQALNVEIEDIPKYVSSDPRVLELLQPSLQSDAKNQDEAIAILTKMLNMPKDKKTSIIKNVLEEKLFQNILNINLKKFYLGHMVLQLLLTVLDLRQEDDRDHYAKKRLETAGILTFTLFKSAWKQTMREAKANLEKKKTIDITNFISAKVSGAVKKAFATGLWNASKLATNVKVGVSDLLNRNNFPSLISNLRRVITPGDKNNKLVKPRHLHSSQFFYLCPMETPEGEGTGLTKNMALLTSATLYTSPETVKNILRLIGCNMLNEDLNFPLNDVKIFINGCWIATVKPTQKEKLIEKLRRYRNDNKIHQTVSICDNIEGIKIYTDEGRLITPFLKVKDGKLIETNDYSYPNLMKNCVDYIDITEAETLLISVYPWELKKEHNYSVIHPSFMFGIAAATAPFINHSQSPRGIYYSSMVKQAVGFSYYNGNYRFDSTSHTLCYPQKPIVNTKIAKLVGMENLPVGQNLIVAIASYTGFNQEDSVIVNKASIDSGILRSFCSNVYTCSSVKKGTVSVDISKPKSLTVKETWSKGYDKLDTDGLPLVNTPLCKRDMVIGKTITTPDGIKDDSTMVNVNRMEEHSVITQDSRYLVDLEGSKLVEKSIYTQNEDFNKTAVIKTRQYRIPEAGDKVASRSAQKGIIGMIMPKEDMPFSKETGIAPDLIMNPNAIPSRMTISQILESVLAKKGCLSGTTEDCTPYEEKFDYKTITEQLEEYGFEGYGDEVMINGFTGEEMKVKIFIGPVYYQRLKHMVSDKIHSRSQTGPRDSLSRQPVTGRKCNGGFKMGEMETHCVISHGASKFMIDRLVNNSDAYETYICDDCGNFAIANVGCNIYECKRCDQNVRISKIKIPYAFKLLQQELMATGVGVWYQV